MKLRKFSVDSTHSRTFKKYADNSQSIDSVASPINLTQGGLLYSIPVGSTLIKSSVCTSHFDTHKEGAAATVKHNSNLLVLNI